MKQLLTVCQGILDQLENVVTQISETDFCRPSSTLSGSSVGQHLRHTLEFFVCLKSGFYEGTINYDKRQHDKSVENDKVKAAQVIIEMRSFILEHPDDHRLILELAYERDAESWITLETSYKRELVYNIEHAVHHMALMKIGIRQLAPYVKLGNDFGIAVSTIRYQEALTSAQ